MGRRDNVQLMRDLLLLAIHLLVTLAKLLRPGGVRAVATEPLLLTHQLVSSNRSRRRAPNLTSLDRFVLGLTTLFVSPRRILAKHFRPESGNGAPSWLSFIGHTKDSLWSIDLPDRHRSPRISRSRVLLERSRSEAEIGGIPGLLQRVSRAPP